MHLNLERQVALISGSTSGFGLLTSITLARCGYQVFATFRDPSRRRLIEDMADGAKVKLELLKLDVTRTESIRDAVAQVEQQGAGNPIGVLLGRKAPVYIEVLDHERDSVGHLCAGFCSWGGTGRRSRA